LKLWIEEKSCAGCAACANACSKNAIEMVQNKSGFEYPQIQDSCVNCSKCKNACPIVNRPIKEQSSTAPKTYVAWSLDGKNRYHSTSGGVFSEFCKIIFKDNGVAVGAQYGKNQRIEHIAIDDVSDLSKIRQSKYAQSYMGYIYREVKALLDENKPVLFCGCPCHASGLHAFLGKDYGNLYTFDFICRGSNSPKAYRKWLDMLESKYRGRATRVWFKNKELGWNNFSTRVDFDNGCVYRKDRYHDLFMRGYLEYNAYIRPSCTKCSYKGFPRISDITIADFWAVDKKYDHDIGSSMIIVNTSQGKKLFDEAKKSMFFMERTLSEARKGNAMLDKSTWLHPKSDMFFSFLDKMPFDKAFNKTFYKEERKKKAVKRNRRIGMLFKSVKQIARAFAVKLLRGK